MQKIQSRRRKLVFSTLGLVLAVPLLAAPVSASVADGAFLIHAQNSDEPKYEAYAGINGSSAAPEDPGAGEEDNSAVLASYSCGALDFAVTQAMVDFSTANEANPSAATSSPDGWQSISRFVPGSGVKLGFNTDGSTPVLAYLNEGMTPVSSPSDKAPKGVKVRAENTSGGCSIFDLRKAPKDRGFFNYAMEKSTTGNPTNNSYMEGRYVTLEDGSLAAARFTKASNSDQSASRTVSPLTKDPARSSKAPYTLTKTAAGRISLMVALKTPVDGYNHVDFTQNADGSGRVQYGSFTTVGSMGPNVGASARTAGPSSISWNSAGQITNLSSSTGVQLSGNGPYTAADYNAATGQSWDGSYHHLDDFDSDVTFTF